jgi:hypothetical protein
MSIASNEGDRIVMRQRERDRLCVLPSILEGKRTQSEAARTHGKGQALPDVPTQWGRALRELDIALIIRAYSPPTGAGVALVRSPILPTARRKIPRRGLTVQPQITLGVEDSVGSEKTDQRTFLLQPNRGHFYCAPTEGKRERTPLALSSVRCYFTASLGPLQSSACAAINGAINRPAL